MIYANINISITNIYISILYIITKIKKFVKKEGIMKEEKLYNKKIYELNNGSYCGIYMEEDVMKKILKLQYEYMNNVKKILNENIDKLIPYDWTLANKIDENGKIQKQVIIHYFIQDYSKEDLKRRIETFKVEQPRYIDKLYCVRDREQAKEIAEEVLQETIKGEK